MTHYPDGNITMPQGTEVDRQSDDQILAGFGIKGDGFVMRGVDAPSTPREVWPGIEDDVRELEQLLRS